MSLTYKSIDTMKASRDSAAWTNQQKIDHCNAIVQYAPDITHITADCYMHNTGFQSIAYVQEWADAIHNAGKKVWWRPVPNYSNAVTAAQAITNVCADITANPTWFANGDIFEFGPESTPYIFSNPPDSWSNSTTTWSQWMADMIAAMNTAFSGIGKSGVITSIQSIVSSYWTQGDVKASALTAFNNQIAIDYYPLDLLDPIKAAQSMLNTIATLRAAYPTADIIISEIGVMNTINVGDDPQREVLRLALNTLANLSYIKGLNYWVGYNTTSGGGFTQLFQTNSRTLPRPALKTLGEFYTKGNAHGRMEVI